LVGRDEAVREVASVVADRGVTVLTGPAGIGKTAVARAALERAGGWSEGGCLATLEWVPYLAFRRLVGAEVTGQPATVAGLVARTLARQDRTAILIDDVQWADEASLDVVAELADRFAIVTTVRTGEPRSREVIDALSCLGARIVDLAPLPEPDARRLVASRHPGMDGADVASVLAHAAGNPLLLSELPHGDSNASTLVSALLGRVEPMDASARTALDRLCVLGRPASPALLGEGADRLVASGLVTVADDEIVMRHPLLAEVLVESMGDRADRVRVELSAQVSAAEAAHLLAASGERTAARAIALRAAPETADAFVRAELLELAISCAPEGVDDTALRIEGGNVFCDLSRFGRAKALCTLDDATVEDAVARGGLRGVAARAAWLAGDADECRRLVDAALADLSGTGTPEEAFILAGSTILDTRIGLDGRPALQRARDAVALADRVGAHQHFARLRLASVLYTAGEPGWVELFEAAIDDASRRGDVGDRRTAVTSLALAHWLTGNPVEAHRRFSAEVDLGPDHDHDVLWLSAHAYAAMIGLLIGVDRGELVERHGPVLADEPLFRTRPLLTTAIGLAAVDAGHLADVDELLAAAAGVPAHRQLDRSLTRWLSVEAAFFAGRLDEADAAGGLAVDAHHPAALHARLVGGHAARQRDGGAISDVEPAATFPAWSGAPIEWRALQAAIDGRHAEAAALFESAATEWEHNDVRSFARCRWAAGDEARLAGVEDAVGRLEVAEAVAERWGLVLLADRCRASLRSCGEAARSPQRSGNVGLTAREEAVLRLVGQGRSTAEIAATLAISASTVDSFARAAVRKLGAANRVAAAAQLARMGSDAQRTIASGVVSTP
jgi:DNA-binding CsgD family transcriptional regulator